jgi:hypothetical protein
VNKVLISTFFKAYTASLFSIPARQGTSVQMPAAKSSPVAPKQTAPARDPATEGSIVTFASTGDPHAPPQAFIDLQAQMAEAEEASANWELGEKAFELEQGFRRQVNSMTYGAYVSHPGR